MINLKFQYRPFASLKVSHEFYTKNLARDLQFLPAPESKALAERIGLFIKKSDAGISISYDVMMGDALLNFLLNNEEIYFDFYLVTGNYMFANFTDMPTESIGSLYYFDAEGALSGQEEDQYQLHPGDFVTNDDRYPVMRTDFYREVKSGEAKYELKDDAGKVYRQADVAGKYAVELNGLPAGKYHVHENGKQQQTFIYQSVDFQRKNTVALIKIAISGQLRQSIISTLERGEVLPNATYSLQFDSRSTYWKYFIVSKYKLPLENSGIETNDSEIEFTGRLSVPV